MFLFLKENITVSQKQGGKLEGNSSRKLLECVDSLEVEFGKHSHEVLLLGMPFMRVLRAFNKVVHTTFGMVLLDGWEAHIREFTDSYRGLRNKVDNPITVTPKVLFNQIITTSQ